MDLTELPVIAMRKMRIAFFVKQFPGVSETFILRQITGLMDLGHDVWIFSQHRPADEVVHADVRKYGLPGRVRYVYAGAGDSTSVDGVPALLARLAFRDPRALLLLRRSVAAQYGGIRSLLPQLSVLAVPQRFDIVHCHFGNIALRIRFVAAHWAIPFVVSFHGSDWARYPRVHGETVYRPLFESADRVTVVASSIIPELTRLGCPADKIREFHVGVDTSEYGFRERIKPEAGRPVRILTVARLVEKKGVEYALRAIGDLIKSGAMVHYDVFGDGPLRTRLEALARSVAPGGGITFHGSADQEAVRQAMECAHLFLLPSVTAADGDQEGTPTVLMEASASGLPVVSTFHSGIPEVILDGRSGLLNPERDVPALRRSLERLISHPDEWAEFGRAGRAHIERHYDTSRLAVDLEALYREVLEERRMNTRTSRRLASPTRIT